MKILKFSVVLLTLFLGMCLTSCQKETLPSSKDKAQTELHSETKNQPSKYEIEKEKIRKKIEAASATSSQRSVTEDDCGITYGPNCTRFTHGLELYADITDCSTSVTDECLIFGEMEITICVDQATGEIEVNFVETLFGHSVDCIIDHDEHTDDWDCVSEVAYQEFVSFMMPIILELWGTNNDCANGYNTALSRYSKELCVYPCTERVGQFYISRLVQCGESTACCVKEDQWCVDSEGNVQVTPGNKYTVGECSPGLIPCRSLKESPFPSSTWNQCQPRGCITTRN